MLPMNENPSQRGLSSLLRVVKPYAKYLIFRSVVPNEDNRWLFELAFDTHWSAREAYEWARRSLIATPLFLSKCAVHGERISVDRIPYITACPRIELGSDIRISGEIAIKGNSRRSPVLKIGNGVFLGHWTTFAVAERIEVGDFVAFDPRVELNTGFVRSRHLADKACAATLVAALQALQSAGLQPAHTTCILFSNFEEVGHGGAAEIPASVEEFVAVDMAAMGEGQASDEFHATLCLKDSGGPYHAGLSQKLRGLAEAYGIPYKVDIYPNYGSDATAYWHAGGAAAAALIGPGVDSSHHYERTHHDALLATTQWVLAYLLAE